MTFDTAFERSHPPNELTKDSDTGIVYQAILGWINDGNPHWNKCLEQGDLGQLSKYLANTVLTTVRKEEREAAFREVAQIAKTENPPHNSGNEYARGFARAKKTIIGKIEAAANTQEGGGDD